MIKQMNQLMEQSGFLKIQANPEEFQAYYKKTEENQFGIVFTIHLHRDFQLTKEMYQNAYQGLLKYFEDSIGKTDKFSYQKDSVKILTIVFAEDIEMAKKILKDTENYWIYDCSAMRLMIFENQPDDFLGIRRMVENLGVFPMNQKRTEEREIPKKKETVRNYYSKNKGRESKSKKIPYKFPLMTVFLMLFNIVIFLYLESRGDTTNGEYMLHYGAMYPPYIAEGGKQYLRFLTAMFLHFGSMHLFNNMVILYFFGDMVERIVGKIRFLMIYFASGLCGNLISYFLNRNQNIVSAGASGAIYGVVGALVLLVIYVKLGKTIRAGWFKRKASRKNQRILADIGLVRLAIMVALILYYGFSVGGIDNAAHLGGFFTGIAVTFVFVWIPWSVMDRIYGKKKRKK